ncbi:MAG: polyketide cyclase [Pseudonocardiales bacterium]|nr:MAG: polyketide cyclase [Pseudonocardiales bacterium]
MSVTSVEKDTESLTMTITAQFDAPSARVWQVWTDPRQLEKWWGPPTYPATVVGHDITPGGTVTYFMTGPEGDTHHGWWRVSAVDAPHHLEFVDGFADADGNPNPDMPVMNISVSLHEESGGTRMQVTTVFPTTEAMEQLAAMGMEEGMTAAMGQIDSLVMTESG